MTHKLAAQTIVLTGASSGIGAEAARLLARRGASMCLVARREDELAEVAADIARGGGTAHTYPVDLTDADAAAALIHRLLADHERIDAVVNNAARSIRRPIADSVDRMHDFERTMAINYFGAVRLTLGLLPRFLEQGHGHVVMSSSMSTQIPIPLFSAYLASKAALESFTRSLVAEQAGAGISATTIHFPMVRTDMSGQTAIYQAMPMMSAGKAARWIEKAIVDKPTRISSLHGTAAEIAMAATPGLLNAGLRPVFRHMDRVLARRTKD